MKTISATEYQALYGKAGVDAHAGVQPTKPETVGGDVSDAFQGGVNYAKQGYEEAKTATNPLEKTEAGGKQLVGALGAAFSPLAPVTKYIGKGVNYLADKISDIPAVQKFAMSKAGANTARVAEDVGNTSALLALRGTGVAKEAVGTAADATMRAASDIGDAAGGATTAIRDAATSVGDTVAPFVQGLSRIPSRIATNAAEKQAQHAAIKELPTETAQKAVQDGIDINDVKALHDIPQEQKPALKNLWNITKDYAGGKKDINPIEAVGKPLTAAIKRLESARGSLGKQLGDVANNLGNVSQGELQPAVYGELKKVPGLNGLEIGANGDLDFKNTTLASELSKTDQMSIDKIYKEAVREGSGKSKHLLRQELFEILGGKKKSLSALTDTEERAFDAVRKGLSNVLDTKNSSYKDINNQFRKVAQPLQSLRKYIKDTGASEDILDMSGGLLARRLTSLAKSNPEIRSVLRSMDEALATKGKTLLNLEKLQDFYNILERYYDVAPKTGFQSQVRSGVEKATGFMDAVTKPIKEFAGETPAVRQKALEGLLQDIFKDN